MRCMRGRIGAGRDRRAVLRYCVSLFPLHLHSTHALQKIVEHVLGDEDTRCLVHLCIGIRRGISLLLAFDFDISVHFTIAIAQN